MVQSDIITIFSTWHVIRAAGLTAYLLLFVISALGLMISLQMLPVKYRSQALVIHKFSAIACVAFTLVHGLMLLFDDYVHFSLGDILIPYKADGYGEGLVTGILAFYSLLVITIVSIPVIMKVVGAAIWRKAHYFALPCYWLALYHGIMVGTDRDAVAIVLLYATTSLGMLVLCGMKMRRIFRK